MRIFESTLMLVAFAIAFAQEIDGQTPVHGCPLQDYKIVSDFDPIIAGEVVSFEIHSKDEEKVEADFTWSVSTGTIIAGQGTSHIMVQTPTDALHQKPPDLVPNSGENGLIFFGGGPHSRTVPLKITAILASVADCGDKRLSTSIYIGRRSEVPNRPANVIELVLGKTELVLACDTNFSVENTIDIWVRAEDPDNDVLIYNYTVSAGKIVGTGANIKWDLSDVAPGT